MIKSRTVKDQIYKNGSFRKTPPQFTMTHCFWRVWKLTDVINTEGDLRKLNRYKHIFGDYFWNLKD